MRLAVPLTLAFILAAAATAQAQSITQEGVLREPGAAPGRRLAFEGGRSLLAANGLLRPDYRYAARGLAIGDQALAVTELTLTSLAGHAVERLELRLIARAEVVARRGFPATLQAVGLGSGERLALLQSPLGGRIEDLLAREGAAQRLTVRGWLVRKHVRSPLGLTIEEEFLVTGVIGRPCAAVDVLTLRSQRWWLSDYEGGRYTRGLVDPRAASQTLRSHPEDVVTIAAERYQEPPAGGILHQLPGQ